LKFCSEIHYGFGDADSVLGERIERNLFELLEILIWVW
jgi:hypothetical protein